MSTLGLMAQVEGTWMLTPKAGSFQNVMGEETYVEGWQGSDGCGAPVAPHDGSASATYTINAQEGTLTLYGKGAFIGLPKVVNGIEIGSPSDAADSITYEVTLVDANNIIFEIEIDAGKYWKFELTRKLETIDPTGYWQFAPKAYAMAVGAAKGNYNYWGNTIEEVTAGRACQFDDYFVFMEDGTFKNIFGDETFIEGWQGTDGCGTPVAPHDGSNDGMWSADAATKTLKVVGKGSFIGLPKVYNGGELSSVNDAKDSIIYEISIVEDTMIVEI